MVFARLKRFFAGRANRAPHRSAPGSHAHGGAEVAQPGIAENSQSQDLSDLEQWIEEDYHRLSAKQLGRGVICCDQSADQLMASGCYEASLRARLRALELVEWGESRSVNQSHWLPTFTHKQFLQSAVCCDRLAERLRGTDDVLTVHWWTRGAKYLERAMATVTEQPEDVTSLHKRQLLDAALACRRIADAAAGEGVTAAAYFEHSAQLYGKALQYHPVQESWVYHHHERMLRDGASAYQGIASETQEDSDRKAVEYWESSVRLYRELLDRYPNQQPWVPHAYQVSLRNGANACRRTAGTIKRDDESNAARYWELSVSLYAHLLEYYPDQPDWVRHVYEMSLRDGASAYYNLANKSDGEDDPAAVTLYWEKTACMFDELLTRYPIQPDWVLARFRHARHNFGMDN